MYNNAKSIIIFGIIISIVSSITTFAWNHQTLDEMVEQKNREAIIDCLTKARTETTAQKILQATETCNSHLFTTVSAPLISTGYLSTWTVNTAPISSEPLWLQLIPSVNATPVEKKTNLKESTKNEPIDTPVIADIPTGQKNIRTPSQIYQQVKHLGYRESPTIALIQSCKDGSLDPQKCILVGLVLLYNESGNNQNSKACITRNNCFGINAGKKVYSSLDEWMDNFVVKYSKYWHKSQSASFFYSSAGKVSPSRYCTSEDSSNTSIGCPHWLAIATGKWQKLYPIIY